MTMCMFGYTYCLCDTCMCLVREVSLGGAPYLIISRVGARPMIGEALGPEHIVLCMISLCVSMII